MKITIRTGMHYTFLTTLALTIILLTGCGSGNSEDNSSPLPPATGSASLAITPTFQQTTVWCWAAAAEMVLRFYNLPNLNPVGNYQCGIVAAWFVNTPCAFDCSLCVAPIGVMSNEYTLITQYGLLANNFGIPSRVLSASLTFRPLAAEEIKAEIDARRPIIIGISPGNNFAIPNASAHVAVLIGYDFDSPTHTVIVNDPFPFSFVPYLQFPHPYLSNGGVQLRQGQYRLPLASLYGALAWGNTIFRIQ